MNLRRLALLSALGALLLAGGLACKKPKAKPDPLKGMTAGALL